MISFVIPTIDELWFRRELLCDDKTMSFNHAYGGCVAFTKDKWQDWYEKWIAYNSSNYYYRYIKDESTDEFIGEVSYHYDSESKRYYCGVIIMAKYRRKGYGQSAIKLLVEEAKNNGVSQLYDDIAIDNSSLNLFIKCGFKIIDKNEECITVCLDI